MKFRNDLKSEKLSNKPDVLHIKVLESLDIKTSSQLLREIKGYKQEGFKNFLIDLSEIELIYSAGIGALAAISNDLKEINGTLVIMSDKPRIKNLFQITSMGKIANVVENLNEAGPYF